MLRIIATDEAGYGPKLGPLIITATVWEMVEGNDVVQSGATGASEVAADRFAVFDGGFRSADGRQLPIGDSKQLFRRGTQSGLDSLEQAVAVFTRLAAPHVRLETLDDLLACIAPWDRSSVGQAPWNQDLSWPFPQSSQVGRDTSAWVEHIDKVLAKASIRCVAVVARVLEVGPFNALCAKAGNKATVLSETTVGLVRTALASLSPAPLTMVYSDRHGGRQRYAPILQQYFSDTLPEIISESSKQSRYRMQHAGHTIDWRFTVQGDRFLPVGLASMFAKYLRERMMERFNDFWRAEHGSSLMPTAGYPVDAVRFLDQIKPSVQRMRIPTAILIRDR